MFQVNPFDVSKRHQRGVWVLIILSIAIIFTPRILQLFQKDEDVFQIEIIPYVVEKTWKKKQGYDFNNWHFKSKKWSTKKKFFGRKPTHTFDPNLLTKDEWISFGLSEKQAEVVLKYTKRGIQSNQELERIKFIPQKVFENIKNFTRYSKQVEEENNVSQPLEKVNKILDLNQVTEEQLTQINGLGPFYSRQILRYRSQLGGFARKEQLKEVWKMTEELYQQVHAQFICDEGSLLKLNINVVSAERLQAHPYLNWNQANSIVKMRQQKGGFKSIEEIKESVIIDQETYEKVRPYLSL